MPWLGDRVRRLLPHGGRILDFGAGPGEYAAFLKCVGYDCDACDDLCDPWHQQDGNRDKILRFNAAAGVDYRVLEAGAPFPWTGPQFDFVLAHHVFEHIPGSPRPLVNLLVSLLRDNGILFIAVPNAANLRKRLALLRGRTNYPPFYHVYWHEGVWRGHVREYVKDDLRQLARYAGLEVVELKSYHFMLGSTPKWTRALLRAAMMFAPGSRDSWYLAARKPPGWAPRAVIDPNDPNAARLARIFH